MNATPSANRLHIGIFGRTNSGKSSFINALTGQQVSIVADVAGTTTDPVYKAMELHPLGACTLIDTAGFDDVTRLGEERLKKTRLAAERTDLAVLLFSAEARNVPDEEQTIRPRQASAAGGAGEPDEEQMIRRQVSENGGAGEPDAAQLRQASGTEEPYRKELEWYAYFRKQGKPVLLVVSQCDRDEKRAAELSECLRAEIGEEVLLVSALTGAGMEGIRTALARRMPENYGQQLITAGLVEDGELVLLVMPQDIQAPKGRLILPQVQTLRELLDRKCMVMSCTSDQLSEALSKLVQPPKLMITDSQVFGYVYERKPKESMLTSFSVLFAAYKGDLPYYVEGAAAIDALTEASRVLIAECCTHAPLEEDIGRVKLPRILRKRVGSGLTVDIVSGTDFPEDLTNYDLIIQCGACMFNRSYVMARIDRARRQGVPMTNYGVAIAHLTGILEQIALPGKSVPRGEDLQSN